MKKNYIKNIVTYFLVMFSLLLTGCEEAIQSNTVPNLFQEITTNNTPPNLSKIETINMLSGENKSIRIEATDIDNDYLIYTLKNAPSWVMINKYTGEIFISPSKENIGNYIFQVNVSDAEEISSEDIYLNISSKFNNIQDITLTSKVALPESIELLGYISDSKSISPLNTVKLDDISFNKKNQLWYVTNNTFMPMSEMVVKYDDNIYLLNLDYVLEPYTIAKIDFSLSNIQNIKYINQLSMFNPFIDLGSQKKTCSDKSKTCYNSPEIGFERDTFERTLGHIHDSFNKISFVKAIEASFKNYSDGLHGYKNYLYLGSEGHHLSMRVMRNVYVAEGVGGGISGNINTMFSTGHGWASIWEGYININSNAYRVLPMNTLFHEIAHAYGFNHASGMTYGFADYVADVYIPQENVDITKIPFLHAPEILVKTSVTENNILSLFLYYKGKPINYSELNIRIFSNNTISFIADYPNQNNKNKYALKFNSLPKVPIYIQIWSNDSEYISTLKFEGYDLLKPYHVNNKSFFILPPELLNKNNSGWEIRDRCNRPNHKLASKDNYQELYDYLKKSHRLSELPFRSYLSSDQPSGNIIWKVDFNNDTMRATWYNMYNSLGLETGLICVVTK